MPLILPMAVAEFAVVRLPVAILFLDFSPYEDQCVYSNGKIKSTVTSCRFDEKRTVLRVETIQAAHSEWVESPYEGSVNVSCHAQDARKERRRGRMIVSRNVEIGPNGTAAIPASGFLECAKLDGNPMFVARAGGKDTQRLVYRDFLLRAAATEVPPFLAMVGTPSLVGASGAVQGVVRGDDRAEIVFQVANRGSGPAYSLTPKVGGLPRGLRVTAVPTLSVLQPGDSHEFRIPLQSDLNLAAAQVTANLSVREEMGNDLTGHAIGFRTASLDRPSLAIARVLLRDGRSGLASGDGDGIAENGERVEIVATVRNDGGGVARGVTLLLDRAPSNATKQVARAEIGDLPPGASRSGSLSLSLPLGERIPVDFPVTLQALDERGAEVGHAAETAEFEYRFEAPELLADLETRELRGNGDGLFQPGEHHELDVEVRNIGRRFAEGVKLGISTRTRGVKINPINVGLGTIEPGGNARKTFTINVKAGAPLGPLTIEAAIGQTTFPTAAATYANQIVPQEQVLVAVSSAQAGTVNSALRAQPAPLGLADQPIDVVPVTATPRNDVHAVVVGIGSYEAALPGLPSARKDAQLVRTYLRKMVGVRAENIRFLRDGQASYLELKNTFKSWLTRRVRRDDLVLVYFAGHGVTDPEDKKAYLMPYDGRPGQPRLTGFQIEEIQGYLQDLPTDRAVLILDTCFSGEGRSVSAPGTRSAAVVIEGPLVNPPRGGRKSAVVLAAAKGDQVAHTLEAEQHGLFTYYLLRALRGEADAAPFGDADGWVSVAETFAFVRDRVPERARREFGRAQTPELYRENVGARMKLSKAP
jgi:hypothetical protein